MGKIQELSEQLANQIAAGEVVERPASVVKELLENAIDAKSTKIEIFIEEAGLKSIQIIDNGEGIAEDDVENAFKRHATSKIHRRDDLFRIRTLGFRGEALPSIASVSKVMIETAVAGAKQGSALILDGGKIISHKPAALRQGTKITVEQLFYNTPARLKYVKTLQTELANIGDVVNRLALSHPEIAFRLVHDGHVMLQTTGSGDLKQTIAGIYGLPIAKKMLPIAAENLDFKLSGFISLPELTRAGRQYLSIMINGRYIKNHQLNRAIINGYGSKLMVGRFPIVVLEIQTDPLLVDVNVHPTKQEVRLSKETELQQLISKAINDKLREQVLIPQVGDQLSFKKKVAPPAEKPEQLKMDLAPNASGKLQFDSVHERFYLSPSSKEAANFQNAQAVEKSVDNHVDECGKTTNHFDNSDRNVDIKGIERQEETLGEQIFDDENVDNSLAETEEFTVNEPSVPSIVSQGAAAVSFPHAVSTSEQAISDEGISQAAQAQIPPKHLTNQHQALSNNELMHLAQQLSNEAPAKKSFPYLEYFGQMHGTYLFAQSDEGLYIIDQHAAQERIKYEYYREKIADVGDDLQELLIPIVLDYPTSDYLKLKEKIAVLSEVGIHLEEFGQHSFIIRAHPTWYPQGQEEAIIREMIDIVLLKGSVSVKEFRLATAIMMSCKRSIKANHRLDDRQARVLLADLAQCKNPYNCPHGRPVLIHFSNTEMERLFKRIQDPH